MARGAQASVGADLPRTSARADRGMCACGSAKMPGMNARSKSELIDRLVAWRHEDEPLVEAIGDTLAEVDRLDSQERREGSAP